MKKIVAVALTWVWVPFLACASVFTTPADSIPSIIMDSSMDSNMDSLIVNYGNQDADNVETDSSNLAEYDSTFVTYDHPDSFYINRLKKIPSVVELTYNDIVKKYIEVYTVKKRDKLEEMLGLKDYYFPLFEEILDANGLPTELKYLSVIESALNPRATSRVGAAGMWQFMYGTGRLYKLNINSYVDERRDPIASTYAAAHFLKDLYSLYNDWVLVIAAYNCGPGNVNKAIRRSGGKRNYWDIYYYLPRETRGYVPAYIAATYAMNYYKDHGLQPKYIDVPPVSDTVMVSQNIHLEQVAQVLDLPLQELRNLNPEYRLDIVPGSYKTSPIRLPEAYATKFIDLEDSIISYKKDIYFSGEFKTITPVNYRYGHYAPAPSGNMQKIYHIVRSGDNLGQISEQYHVRISDLRYWNNINRNLIRTGQKLVIYVPKSRVSHTVVAQNSSSNSNQSGDYIYYKVKDGDTLWEIARQYPGVSDQDIRNWNNLALNTTIQPGQTLKIKKSN